MLYKLLVGFLFLLGKPETISVNQIITEEVCEETYAHPFMAQLDSLINEDSIPKEIVIAVACLESRYGESGLYKRTNNAFSIKCFKCVNVVRAVDETYLPPQPFKKYTSLKESVEDFLRLMRTKRYRHLLGKGEDVWLEGLRKAGYATDVQYSIRLKQVLYHVKAKIRTSCSECAGT